MAKLVKPNGEITDIYPANGKSFSLEEMQVAVDGYIEYLPTENPLFSAIINEEGKLRNMPRNDVATHMCWPNLREGDFVVGNVLVGTPEELGMNE